MFQLTGVGVAGRDGCDGLVLELPTLTERLDAVLQRTGHILKGDTKWKQIEVFPLNLKCFI